MALSLSRGFVLLRELTSAADSLHKLPAQPGDADDLPAHIHVLQVKADGDGGSEHRGVVQRHSAGPPKTPTGTSII